MVGIADRTNLLSLALGARHTIRSLNKFRSSGTTSADLTVALTDAVRSLNAMGEESLFARLQEAPSSYENYEQIATLDEAKNIIADDKLVEKLSSISKTNLSEEERVKNADLAIRFFKLLENRALQKYHQCEGHPLGY